MGIYNKNRSNVNIQLEKNQTLSKGMYEAIQLEAQMAIGYLPSEDKVQLGLSCANLNVVADPNAQNTLRKMTQELQEKLLEAEKLLAAAKVTP
tara:strand:- start:233 stop:511 length:279 start_codon:yes stop_codon:yes gene_type:complete